MRCRLLPSAFNRKVEVLKKECSCSFVRVQTSASQAVRMPPEAPSEGLAEQDERRTGRKLLRFASEMCSSLVSCRQAKVGRVAMSSHSTSSQRLGCPSPRTFQEKNETSLLIMKHKTHQVRKQRRSATAKPGFDHKDPLIPQAPLGREAFARNSHRNAETGEKKLP